MNGRKLAQGIDKTHSFKYLRSTTLVSRDMGIYEKRVCGKDSISFIPRVSKNRKIKLSKKVRE